MKHEGIDNNSYSTVASLDTWVYTFPRENLQYLSLQDKEKRCQTRYTSRFLIGSNSVFVYHINNLFIKL